MDNYSAVLKSDTYTTMQLANAEEYQNQMLEAQEDRGTGELVTPIQVDMPASIVSQDQVANNLLQTARNTNTMARDLDVVSVRKLDVINPETAFKLPSNYQLDDKDVIFKYVPLNKVNKQMINGSNSQIEPINYSYLCITSLIAFIICYFDNSTEQPAMRILKSVTAAFLGIIYILAYLIRFTITKTRT